MASWWFVQEDSPGELRLAELLLLESPRCRLLLPPCCKLPLWK
jgi:hypothetical protein